MSFDLAEIPMPTQMDQAASSGVNRVGDHNRRSERRQRLAEQEFVAADRRGEHRLQGSLLSLADHRVRRD